MTIEYNEREAAAAAKLCAACEHEPNEHGVCVFCGALQPGKVASRPDAWEPPVQRSRLFHLDDAPGTVDSLRNVLRERLLALPADECQQCLHHREMYRRVWGRWGDFDAAVIKAQELMRASMTVELLAAAEEIDRIRTGIGGQP